MLIVQNFIITAEYPTQPVNIVIKSKNLSPYDQESLLSHLNGQQNVTLLEIPSAAKTWLDQQNIDLTSIPSTPEKKKREKLKGKKNKSKVEEPISGKAAPMKTAEDVINRILWDEQLPNECFVIGYLDRFVGVTEKPFSVFSWEDLASVDYDVLAIPKHRIQYFKYKSRVVWDKLSRRDDVFGSTGGTQKITDIIQEVNEEEREAKSHQPDTAISDSEDSDDDIEIDTGCSLVQKNDSEASVIETPLFPREKYWGARIRPTHFLALRITNPEVIAKVKELHDCILEMEPDYNQCVIHTDRLHMTLACLGLDTEEDIARAVTVLKKYKEDARMADTPKIDVTFQNLEQFVNNTLYASAEPKETITEFVNNLKLAFWEAGVSIRDVFDFVPHMTILKLSMQFGREKKTRYLDPRLFQAFGSSKFGSQTVDNISLCTMSDDRQPDGFYICPASITLD